jgi:glycosyltransferase involved in cell wall biosynthesis
LHFVIHGRGWEEFFKNNKPSNLDLLPFDKIRHPDLMRNASLSLSLSKNEGGPFPLLEALASGTPVVCSRTGFATEVVSNESGVVLSAEPTLKEIKSAMRKVIFLKQKVYNQNLLPPGHDWKSFAQTLYML